MEPAFAGPPVLTKSAYRGRALATTSLAGTRLCVAPSRRVHSVYTVCVAVDKESKASQKKGPPKKGEEEEELLDEAAMRAAEIHEVLGGLRDFKNRIIDGAFSFFFDLALCHTNCIASCDDVSHRFGVQTIYHQTGISKSFACILR